jgi:4,5-dihydroxyphthalate decarboxylase
MVAVLHTALGDYLHNAALRSGAIASDLLRLDFADVKPANRAFAPMVREGRFDVCEMAIATYLQAIAYDKPLVLLPVVMAARHQEQALICRRDGPIAGPADLRGRRIGVRSYSQTTALWLRGWLQEAFGIAPDQMRWVTFEDAHVAEYHDPAWVERREGDPLTLLCGGEVDAAILGNELPEDPSLRTVFSDLGPAAAAFQERHPFVPVNHLVTVRRDLALQRPELVVELMRIVRAAQADSGAAFPIGRRALEPAIALAVRYADEQGLLPRRLNMADVWAGLPNDPAFD